MPVDRPIQPFNKDVPTYTKEETLLFIRYRRERQEQGASHDIRAQKRHAEEMLEVFRPKWFLVYKLTKQGKNADEICKELEISAYTVNKHRILAREWLQCALLNNRRLTVEGG